MQQIIFSTLSNLQSFLQFLSQANNKQCATPNEKINTSIYYLLRNLMRFLTNLAALTFEISEGSISVSAFSV